MRRSGRHRASMAPPSGIVRKAGTWAAPGDLPPRPAGWEEADAVGDSAPNAPGIPVVTAVPPASGVLPMTVL